MFKRTIAAFMTTLMVSALLIAQGTAATKLTGTVTTADIKVGSAVMVEAKMDTAMNMYTAQQVEVATTVTVPDPKK